MKFLFITNDPEVARFVVAAGVDRVFVDLEILGKHARQGHLNTVISAHSISDVAQVRAATPNAELVVRTNPLHDGTVEEVDRVISAGADTLMLPMFRSATDVAAFTQMVRGRARTCLLAETAGAMHELRDCVRVSGVDEVHVGLNDLHRELGQRFIFEPLASGVVDSMAAVLNEEGKPFGIGGIARCGEGLLPAELIMAEHVRLGSTAAILSRTFHRQANSVPEIAATMDFQAELAKLRRCYAQHMMATVSELSAFHEEVKRRVQQILGQAVPTS